MGILVGLARYENLTIERKLKVCGQIITREPPQFMEECAVAWAIGLFRLYVEGGNIPQRSMYKPTVHAGSTELTYELRE